VGLPLARRRFYALARKTLWDQKAVGWLITQLGALPVDQENPGDLKAMRACIDVLKRDQMLLIYPEGARSLSGQVEAFQPGTMLLIKRARPTVVPVGIAGADGVWERGRKLPAATGRLGVSFGEPIPASTLLAMSAQDAVGMLRERVVGLVDQTRSRLE
jgi:1-acyl-sn-glycerol-3-phosphate acyltransferase